MADRNALLHLISWWSSSQGGPADCGVFSMVTCTSGSNSQAPSQLALCLLLLEGSSVATFGQL